MRRTSGAVDITLCAQNNIMKLKFNAYWGLIGLLGILGYIMNEPLYYVFFVFFLFFLVPVARKKK